jgi:hypothetical protein
LFLLLLLCLLLLVVAAIAVVLVFLVVACCAYHCLLCKESGKDRLHVVLIALVVAALAAVVENDLCDNSGSGENILRVAISSVPAATTAEQTLDNIRQEKHSLCSSRACRRAQFEAGQCFRY